MSGFQHAPGTPERRAADRGWIERHRVAAVKNPGRYNTDRPAFGLTGRHLDDDGWHVTWRDRAGRGGGEDYPSLDELLDDGWTVD